MARRNGGGNNSRGPEVKAAINPLEKMKLEIATELGIPNYDQLNKGDLPARVHGKIGGNMVRRMITNYQALMSNPQNEALVHQSNAVADAQLAQDKQIIQQRYGSIIQKETEESTNGVTMDSGDAEAQVTTQSKAEVMNQMNHPTVDANQSATPLQ